MPMPTARCKINDVVLALINLDVFKHRWRRVQGFLLPFNSLNGGKSLGNGEAELVDPGNLCKDNVRL